MRRKPPLDPEVRVNKVRERIKASVSGCVRVSKFSPMDRGALKTLIDRGEVEIFASSVGRAYRLTAPVMGETKEGS